MPVQKSYIPDFNLTSNWKCKKENGVFVFDIDPTLAKKVSNFVFSIPSGAEVTKTRIYAKITAPDTGYSVRNVNGNQFGHSDGVEEYADVSIDGNAGTLAATFSFKANGVLASTESRSAVISFRDVYLAIEYGYITPASPTPAKSGVMAGTGPTTFSVPPQSVAIHNQETNEVYTFDGVLRIQHNFSVKLDQEPDKHREEYVNNARNEADRVILDVVMSDVYSGGSSLVNGRGWEEGDQGSEYSTMTGYAKGMEGSRSWNAVRLLHQLKQDRTKVSVLTPQYVHINMLVTSVTIEQNEDSQFGWTGQIEIQKVMPTYPPEENKENDNTSAQESGSPPPGKTIWAGYNPNKPVSSGKDVGGKFRLRGRGKGG